MLELIGFFVLLYLFVKLFISTASVLFKIVLFALAVVIFLPLLATILYTSIVFVTSFWIVFLSML